MKYLFTFNILFKSHLMRHSGTGHPFKDTQKALKHLRYLESTQALGRLESTQRALGHSDGTRALGHLRYWDTQTLRAFRHLGTRALRHLGTQGTLCSRLIGGYVRGG